MNICWQCEFVLFKTEDNILFCPFCGNKYKSFLRITQTLIFQFNHDESSYVHKYIGKFLFGKEGLKMDVFR